MDEHSAGLPGEQKPAYRCPRCDSVVPEGASQCLMCGLPRSSEAAATSPPAHTMPAWWVQKERRSPATKIARRFDRSAWLFWGATALVGLFLLAGWQLLRGRDDLVMAALVPTSSPIPPTITYTPTWTPLPTETLPPSATPTITLTPEPTSTPREPRFHTVAGGETLIGLSLFYRVTADSIAQTNGFEVGSPIQSGQTLQIPWPTATPPLESVVFELNGQPVIASAEDCEIVTIQSGDSAYGLSAAKGVPLEAIILVNRQTMESVQLLQPGDALCIPRIIYADTLPPTPGPSPTASPTPPPAGPALLYPVEGAVIDDPDGQVALQWTAVKDLAENEWYMVELRRVDEPDSLPYRGFTRDTTFRLPAYWRPQEPALHPMRWQVSIVQVTGRRSDGGFTYIFGGEAGRPSHFSWQGAPPTPTPTLTPTATPEP